MRIKLGLILGLMLTCLTASAAKAQDYRMAVPDYAQAYTIPLQNLSRNLRYRDQEKIISGRLRARRASSPAKAGPVSGRAPASAGSAGSTTFRPVAAQILPQLIAQDKAHTTQERKELEEFFTRLLNAYKDALRRWALRLTTWRAQPASSSSTAITSIEMVGS